MANQREMNLLAALIELESSDDSASDPIANLHAPVRNRMSDAEKAEKRAEAAASKSEGDEQIAERAAKLTAILKSYVEGKISDSNGGTS